MFDCCQVDKFVYVSALNQESVVEADQPSFKMHIKIINSPND